MKTVIINEECKRLIQSKAAPCEIIADNSEPLGYGLYRLELDDEVIARLWDLHIKGESISETIIRAISTTQ
jgi:hypothetical protein